MSQENPLWGALRRECLDQLVIFGEAHEGINDIYHAWRRRSPNGLNLFPSLSLLE
jgi:hypothetical protein